MKAYKFLYNLAIVFFTAGFLTASISLLYGRLTWILGLLSIFISVGIFAVWLSKSNLLICRNCFFRMEPEPLRSLVTLSIPRKSVKCYCPKCRRTTRFTVKQLCLWDTIY